VISYTYDLPYRQTAITYPAGTANVAFAYDALSQRTVMTDGTGTTTWTFDAVGRPITITQPNVGNVGYGYDSAGDRTRLSYPDGKVVTYAYDLAARLVNVTDWQFKTTSYSYNALGQPITVTLPNGVTSRYSYDNAGRLAVISHTTLTQTLGVYTYTLDAMGNRVQVTETLPITNTMSLALTSRGSIASGALSANGTRGSVTGFNGGSAFLAFTHLQPVATQTLTGGLSTLTINYGYDPLYRLTAANYSSGQVYTYTYDAVGNQSSAGAPAGINFYTYDAANRVNTVNGQAYTWDNKGNLRSDGVVSYTYDAANRLTALSPNTHTFSYDGMGDRVQQLTSSTPITYTLDQGAGLTQVLAEITGTQTTAHLYGLTRLSQQTLTGTQYFLDDGLGSVRELVDASGNLTLVKRYDPYGQTIASVGSGGSNYGFAAEYEDSTQLYYLRARYYTSRSGRFIQKDSWAGDDNNPQSLNAWAYVGGDPISFTDPSGHYRWRNVRNFSPSAPPGSAESWQHQFIENEIERRYGGSTPDFWSIVLEYTIPRTYGQRVDVINLPNASNQQSALQPSGGTASLYEIEPVTEYDTGVSQLTGYLTKMVERSYRMSGQTPDLKTYDWTKLQWQIGSVPIPAEPFAFTPPGYSTSILVWYQDKGVILYAQSTDPIRNFKNLPPVVIDWLQSHQNESRENQQFAQMLEEARARQAQPASTGIDSSTVVGACIGVIVVGGTILILADPIPGDEVALPALWSLLLVPR